MAKQIEVTSYFKKVSDKAANPRAGQKRADLVWSFQGLEPSDVASADQSKVADMVNAMILAFGRKQIAEASDDWNFVPKEVNFEAAWKDLTAENTKTRLITKESLKALAAFYEEHSIVHLGVSIVSAKTGASLIEGRFKSVLGQKDVLKAMHSRIESLVEVMAGSEEEEVQEAILPFADLIEGILKELETLQVEMISADAL